MNYKIIFLILFTGQLFGVFAQLSYVNNSESNFLKLMFVGDLSINREVLNASYNKKIDSYDFQYLFHYIRPVLNLGDVVVGNIDHTFGNTKKFLDHQANYVPKEYAIALKYAGFNLLTNANKTSVYQDEEQWKENNDFYQSVNLRGLGTFENIKERRKEYPTIVEKHGIKVAYLNYIYALPFNRNLMPLINGFQEDVFKEDVKDAKNLGADYVVVYMYWGGEYDKHATASQRRVAEYCIKEGANMVVGAHPSYIQEVFIRDISVNENESKSITAYSLGNFINTSENLEENGACILEVVLKKDNTQNVVVVQDIGFISTFTAKYDEDGVTRYAVLPVSQVEKDNISLPITKQEQKVMSKSSDYVRKRFSAYMREVEYELDDEIIDDVAEVLTVTRRPLNEQKDFALEINKHLLNLNLNENENIAETPITYKGIVYKVLFLSLRRDIPVDVSFYKHLKGYETYVEDEYYNYVIGNFRNLKQANDFCLDVKRLGHKYAYVVAFENGVRVR